MSIAHLPFQVCGIWFMVFLCRKRGNGNGRVISLIMDWFEWTLRRDYDFFLGSK